MTELTHLDKNHNPRLVDITQKSVTFRKAKATAEIFLPDELLREFKENEIHTKKGPVITTAIIAGTQAVKSTPQLIPFCHSIPIESIQFDSRREGSTLYFFCEVSTTAKTGVEMEALTGVQIASLTFYDMCKAMSHNIQIRNVRLLQKSGGKSDYLQS